MTRHRSGGKFTRRPLELQFHQWFQRINLWTKMIDRQVWIMAENFIGIEQMIRIEKGLDLLEDSIQFTILRLEERRSRETKPMLATDRPADRNCRVIEISRQFLQKGRIEWRRQERPHVELTDRRMGVK